MKKVLLILALFLSLLVSNYSQTENMSCITNYTESTWNGQIGGRYLTSEGTIRVLLVFAQFPDDNYLVSDAGWPKNQAPASMNNWVDESWNANATTGYLTDYFNDMSFNKFKFIGKEVSVISPHTRQWYFDNFKQRGFIHKEIIQALDATWDFGQFDNWDYNGDYVHINQADGVVEMIIFVWRNIAHELSNPNLYYQRLDMGRSGSIGGSDFTVDNGLRTIKAGYGGSGSTPYGSGATLTDWFSEDMFRFSIHEFGHYLLGGNDQHVGHGFWGLCSGWGVKSYVANSFERYKLGWINLNTIQSSPDQTISNATLPDYITTGVAYRFVVDAATNQYFYIENHQKQSLWETTRTYQEATIENGIYVLRQDGIGGDNTFIKCLAADGRYNWTVNQRIQSPWGPEMLPVFKILNPDRVNGYTDLQYIPWTWNGIPQSDASIHFIEDPITGQPVLDVEHWGDGTDGFRIDYNQMFSPYSNPNSQRSNKTATPFGFNINGFSFGVASLDIYVGTSLAGPPSKPQNPILSSNPGNNYVRLIWEHNLETDKAYYEVSRKVYELGGIWQVIGTTTNNYFVDNEYYYSNPVGDFGCTYRLRVKDTQNKFSVYSDEVSIRAEMMGKIAVTNEVVREYNLDFNYPNPFNPSTVINYAVKEAGLVRLKVYDILGAEVAELVNEIKESGNHTIEFNASHLPSGVYIYTLQVNGFTGSKKMLLMK